MEYEEETNKRSDTSKGETSKMTCPIFFDFFDAFAGAFKAERTDCSADLFCGDEEGGIWGER